jgi:hypothetical protein
LIEVAEPFTTTGCVLEQIFITSSLVRLYELTPMSPQHPCKLIFAPPFPAVISQLTHPSA